MATRTTGFEEELTFNLIDLHLNVDSYRDRNLSEASLLDELNSKEELQKIYHLIEAHCPVFRQLAINLFTKASYYSTYNTFPMDSDDLKFQCPVDSKSTDMDEILMKLEMMPPEWTLVQVTNMNNITKWSGLHSNTNPLQITVFQCGQGTNLPFTVNIPAAINFDGEPIHVMKELHKNLHEINLGYTKLSQTHSNMTETYSQFKLRVNTEMKQIVKCIQNKWLAEWRILFSGKFSSNENEQKVEADLNTLLKENNSVQITPKRRQILRCLLRSQNFVDSKETKKILEYCFPDFTTETIINMIKTVKSFDLYAKEVKNPIILVVDETIDAVPWEMLDILSHQPVSRMQSFHHTYALFRAHESEIENGRKIIQLENVRGGSILNPGLNLPQMEHRMKSFQKYWLSTWRTLIGKRPTGEEFLDYLINCDIFMYGGHGDGMQYVPYSSLEKLRINAVVLLFGCKSVALKQVSPQMEPWGTNQYYIMCCCPAVIGNLYNITDLDCDLLCTNFLSQWVPGPLKKPHWLELNRKSWHPGATEIDIVTLPRQTTLVKTPHIPDLLTALNKAKWNTKCTYITQAACIARGIPVKLV